MVEGHPPPRPPQRGRRGRGRRDETRGLATATDTLVARLVSVNLLLHPYYELIVRRATVNAYVVYTAPLKQRVKETNSATFDKRMRTENAEPLVHATTTRVDSGETPRLTGTPRNKSTPQTGSRCPGRHVEDNGNQIPVLKGKIPLPFDEIVRPPSQSLGKKRRRVAKY